MKKSFETTVFLKALDPNKAHGHDEISIRTINLCASSIPKPSYIFENCFESEYLPKEWKKADVVPVHKKVIEQLLFIDQCRYC